MICFSANTLIEMKDEFEQELNILSTQDLGTYLGFPLRHRKPSIAKLNFAIDKLASKLASWKSRRSLVVGPVSPIVEALKLSELRKRDIAAIIPFEIPVTQGQAWAWPLKDFGRKF